ncbi:lysophospholipase [Gammaproteobacteria bacterium]|nr:lysophospholipase [Gammaproteobacteria bacterium]
MLFYILMQIIPLDHSSSVRLDFALFESKQDLSHGVVQISHGMAEHLGRYENFISHLNDEGFHVIIHNHRGHGDRLVDGKMGFFASEGGWSYLVDDLISIHEWAVKQYPELPHILLGHSMGSWVAMSALQKVTDFNVALISGSSKPKVLETIVQKLLVRIETMRLGPSGYSNFLHKTIFGGFNAKFKDANTPNDWLSRDQLSVDDYTKDPLCGFVVTNQLWLDIIEGVSNIFIPDNLDLISKKMPMLVFSGSEDPVGGMGKGTTELHNSLVESGCKSTLLLIQGARHETLNETDKMDTYQHVISFLKNNLTGL